jgi:type I restriction enzyme S subunit
LEVISKLHCNAKGAVRERMLFNRLADGEIELPDYKLQLKASESLKQLRQLKSTFTQGLKELELIPDKLLKQVFDGFASNN